MLERKRPLPSTNAPSSKKVGLKIPNTANTPTKRVATPREAAPKKHRHTGFIAATTLSVVLALGLAGLGYFAWSHSQNLLSRNDSLSAQVDELSNVLAQEQAQVDVPFFYLEYPVAGGVMVHMVDHETGEDRVVYQEETKILDTLIVPQLNFDGHIFVAYNEPGEASKPHKFYVKDVTGTPTLVPFADQLPYARDGAVVPSPDGTRVVAAYDAVEGTLGEFDKHLVAWDLSTGESTIIGRIGADESFSVRDSINPDDGGRDISVRWLNLDCVVAQLYQDDPANPEGPRVEKELRTFCLGN